MAMPGSRASAPNSSTNTPPPPLPRCNNTRDFTVPATTKSRCPWAKSDLMIAYHDTEWGVPVHDDRRLFEFLILEGAQAGLSWETILRKRENYRKAFHGFRAENIAS